MSLPAAELRRHVEDGVRLCLDAIQPVHFPRQSHQVGRQYGLGKEPFGLLIVIVRAAIPHLIEMNGKLGSIQRLAFAKSSRGFTTSYQGLSGIGLPHAGSCPDIPTVSHGACRRTVCKYFSHPHIHPDVPYVANSPECPDHVRIGRQSGCYICRMKSQSGSKAGEFQTQ